MLDVQVLQHKRFFVAINLETVACQDKFKPVPRAAEATLTPS